LRTISTISSGHHRQQPGGGVIILLVRTTEDILLNFTKPVTDNSVCTF